MPAMAYQNVWLITGASSGLGSAIAVAALKAGHKVIAGARNPAKAALDVPEIEAMGGQWLELDVTAKDTQRTVYKAIEQAGRIDVVVNVAGYIIVGALEDLSDDEIEEQMDTNFFGALRVLRGAIPHMRTQKSGTIMNMSSVFGYTPQPAAAMYTASKHALEGLSASLAFELAGFNIRVVLAEPGFFRTNVCRDMRIPRTRLSEPYTGTVVQQAQAFADYCVKCPTRMPGDPAKLGDRVVEFVDGTGVCASVAGKGYMRLVLGKESVDAWRKQLTVLRENVDAMETVAQSTAFDVESEPQGASSGNSAAPTLARG